jgi:chlorite dismutase
MTSPAAASPRLVHFTAGTSGVWSIRSIKPYRGETLPFAPRLDIAAASEPSPQAVWTLRGVTSNHRYLGAEEKEQLVRAQADLGRPGAKRAALIPIRKNAAWWSLTQSERLAIFEETSRHTAIGLKYLPAIARRLHHCRDLASAEPFDFLTYFDYAEIHVSLFEELVRALRATEEWKYVDREVDIRLAR